MLAIMSDRKQHTLLTRFVPVALGDVELLHTKIQKILADVDMVLSAATDLLTDGRDQTS